MTKTEREFILTNITAQRDYARDLRGTDRFAVEAHWLIVASREALAGGISRKAIRAAGGVLPGHP